MTATAKRRFFAWSCRESACKNAVKLAWLVLPANPSKSMVTPVYGELPRSV